MLKSIFKRTIARSRVFIVFFLIISLYPSCCCKSGDQAIKNVETFTRLYGYVKYFYPGDEAAAMDWNRFAVYGVKRVENAANSVELKKILEELFLPIAPALVIHESDQKTEFSLASVTPPNPEEMKVVTWLHYGVGFGNADSIYKSIRLNRKNTFANSSFSIGNLLNSIDAAPLRGKQIKLKAAVKTSGCQGQMWLRVDRPGGKLGFFDNMDSRPIQSEQWNYYEISGTVDTDATNIFYGCFLKGAGHLWLDDFQLWVKEDNDKDTWKPAAIKNPGFEEDEDGQKPKEWQIVDSGYSFQVTSSTASAGKKSLSMESQAVVLTEPVTNFEHIPALGEYIAKDLGSGLSCIMPIALQGTAEYTFPRSPLEKLALLTEAIKKEVPGELSAANLYVRLADITIAWNVFQHFYPYFDVMKIDWKSVLTESLQAAYLDKTPEDFLDTLSILVAKLKDGHGRVNLRGYTGASYFLPFKFEWIQGQWVITEVFDESLTNIRVGDVVVEINGMSSQKATEDKGRLISAATDGWKYYRLSTALLSGDKDEEFRLKLARDGNTSEVVLHASFSAQQFYSRFRNKKITSKNPEPGIYYLNLDAITLEEMNRLMPELEAAKAIICDLRGYPNGNHGLINHLLKEKENALWMWVPKVVYPDFQQVDYDKLGWNMEPVSPTLTAKIIFITDGRAISYAESYMGYIEGLHLATIVGQPTAGTNGNVNIFELPGGYSVGWTGMRVVKHDGSQHHGVGIIPQVRVERTIEGVKQGRDEFLEKALEIARQ